MAQTEEEKLQASLFAQLEKEDVKVADDKVAQMKENIEKASTGQSWLGLGVHEVFVKSIELTQAKTGTLGMKFTVENEEGKNEVTKWLSEGALPYTIENVSRLIVHNTPEDKKTAARNHMANIVSAKDIVAIAKEKLIEGQVWLSVKDKGDTYTDTKTGELKPSYDRDLLSYKPKQTQEQAVAELVSKSKDASPEEKLNIPF
jgi:hypothetical protein